MSHGCVVDRYFPGFVGRPLRTTPRATRVGCSLEGLASIAVISDAARYRPAVTPSLKSSRRHDSATDADWLGLIGCIHGTALDPGLWPAVLVRDVGAVGGTPGIVQELGQRTNGLVGEGRGTRWLS